MEQPSTDGPAGLQQPGTTTTGSGGAAATVLLRLGVPERAATDVMGWPNVGTAKRYQHVTDVLRHDIAARIDGLLRARTETTTETVGDGERSGPGTGVP